MTSERLQLDPTRRSADSQDFETGLRQRIVGQDKGVERVVALYQVFRAGLHSPARPVGNLLLLGPTGSGKTRLVEAIAEVLLGDSRAMIKVDCGEFQHSHEIAKLIGSPPGYIGHRETHPLITQERLEEFRTETLNLSVLLFDEIEKASDALWQLLLGMLDRATLTLGDNRRVDLSQTLIFMTSNLGGREIAAGASPKIGFSRITAGTDNCAQLDVKLERTAKEAAKRKFTPEFMNRIDEVIVFHSLGTDHLQQILDLELRSVERRVRGITKSPFSFHLTSSARAFILQKGTNALYGARHLKRAIEQYLVHPMSCLLATNQIVANRLLVVDWDSVEDRLVFWQEERSGATHSNALSERDDEVETMVGSNSLFVQSAGN